MFDWIIGFIDSVGWVGIALLMFAENVFPPMPSELIMPLAGFNAARGEQSLWLVIAAGSAGSYAGAALWYWIGLRVGAQRLKRFADQHGRLLTISPEDIDRSNGWFQRNGGIAVLIGRLIPTVRTFISVPAGVARMAFWRFSMFTLIGTVAWTTLLALAGYFLEGQYERVASWLNPMTLAVFAAIVAVYLWRVRIGRGRQEQAEKSGT